MLPTTQPIIAPTLRHTPAVRTPTGTRRWDIPAASPRHPRRPDAGGAPDRRQTASDRRQTASDSGRQLFIQTTDSFRQWQTSSDRRQTASDSGRQWQTVSVADRRLSRLSRLSAWPAVWLPQPATRTKLPSYIHDMTRADSAHEMTYDSGRADSTDNMTMTRGGRHSLDIR